jgi:crotonobetainyl-CoA:carnitine CoA-transferase CaiB-like acyl-CoA transferase
MLDTQISLLNYMATLYLLSGELPARLGNAHFVHVPYDTFQTADGYIILAVITDNFWRNLMALLDLPELDSAENQTQPGRARNREVITRRLNELFQTNSQRYWIEQLRGARIPCAPVYNLAQALNDEQVLARQMVVEVPHPQGGTVRLPGNPIKLSASDEDVYHAPPLLGEHTGELLRALGKTEQEISVLREAGVI